MEEALFQISHSNENIKENPIFSIEALKAMRNLKPDSKGMKRAFKELGKINFEYQSMTKKKTVLCKKCGKKLINQIDPITKKLSPYLWRCECWDKGLVLIIG